MGPPNDPTRENRSLKRNAALLFTCAQAGRNSSSNWGNANSSSTWSNTNSSSGWGNSSSSSGHKRGGNRTRNGDQQSWSKKPRMDKV
eukprot:12159273-Karenia_brevis.AAC.1